MSLQSKKQAFESQLSSCMIWVGNVTSLTFSLSNWDGDTHLPEPSGELNHIDDGKECLVPTGHLISDDCCSFYCLVGF